MRSACWAALYCVRCLLKHQHVYTFASYATMATHSGQWGLRTHMHVGFRQRKTHGNVLLRPAADRIQGTVFSMKSNEGLSSIAQCWEVDEDECCGRALHGATRCTQGVAPPPGLFDDRMHRCYAINGAAGSSSLLMGKPSSLSLVPTDHAASVNPLVAPFTSTHDVKQKRISCNSVLLAGLKVVYSMSWRFVHTGRAGWSIVYIGFERQGIIPIELHSRPRAQDAWEHNTAVTVSRILCVILHTNMPCADAPRHTPMNFMCHMPELMMRKWPA